MIDSVVKAVMTKFNLPAEEWPYIYKLAKTLQSLGDSDQELYEKLDQMVRIAKRFAGDNVFDSFQAIFSLVGLGG